MAFEALIRPTHRVLRGLAVALSVVVVSVASGRVLTAQGSPRVPLGDPAYAQIDQVVGSGLVRVAIRGQRPWTRAEVARIIAEAQSQLTGIDVSRSTRRVLDRLASRFAPELRNLAAPAGEHPVRSGRRLLSRDALLELVSLDSPPRDIPSAPVGTAEADINPLLGERAARRYGQGVTLAADIGAVLRIGNRGLLELRPRLASGGNVGSRFSEITLQQASIGLPVGNLMIDVGRQSLVWGQGMEAGLLLSASGRPLDMIRFETMRPWRAPWVLRWLGLLRGSAFLADLGPRQNFPHAKIAAYKVSSQMTSYFELSAAVLSEQGGRGSPPVKPIYRLSDLVPVLHHWIHTPNNDEVSNKLAGFDARARIPALHGLQLYGEVIFDDLDDRRWTSSFTQDAGQVVGASLAQLGPQGALSAAGEWHHTGLRYYQHTTFNSGVTFNRTLLGDPLGPQADAGYVRLRFDAGGASSWRLDVGLERRGGDEWQTFATPPKNADFHFVLLRHHPAEWRHRVSLQWTRATSTRQQLTLQGGVERVRDAAFVPGARRTNALAAVEWTWLSW